MRDVIDTIGALIHITLLIDIFNNISQSIYNTIRGRIDFSFLARKYRASQHIS